MKAMINRSHIEGLVYEHTLEMKESGPNSKNPGTQFITGTLSIATDADCTNIVPVHFTYVTATTSKGSTNNTFSVLNDIITEKVKNVMKHGRENAGKVKIDSAIGVNDFYTDRNGNEELVSAKRNEGGFVHTVDVLAEDEKTRNTFECDMLITGTTRVEANDEKQIEEKVVVKGAIFDFRKALLPVEFIVRNPKGMDYFEGLGATAKDPVFTKVWGNQISSTVVSEITEESAFGDQYVREVKNSRKDWVVVGASKEPYVWDDESTITAKELADAIATRTTYLATVKQRQDEYKASKNQPAPTQTGGFKF